MSYPQQRAAQPVAAYETARRGKMVEKVLVTGGFGLVGSQTVLRLVDDGHRVVAVPGLSLAQLADLRVRRVSTGSLPYSAAINTAVEVAQHVSQRRAFACGQSLPGDASAPCRLRRVEPERLS